MSQKPSLSLSLSHLLFKYVSFPELWVFKTGWWCLTGNLTTSTALTTQHTLRLVFFNPIWPMGGGPLCPPLAWHIWRKHNQYTSLLQVYYKVLALNSSSGPVFGSDKVWTQIFLLYDLIMIRSYHDQIISWSSWSFFLCFPLFPSHHLQSCSRVQSTNTNHQLILIFNSCW